MLTVCQRLLLDLWNYSFFQHLQAALVSSLVAASIAAVHQAKEKNTTSLWGGEAKTQTCHEPCPWHSDSQLGGNSKPELLFE